MKNTTKCILSIIVLAVLSAALFSACKPSDSDGKTGDRPGTSAAPSGYVYIPSYIDLPAEVTQLNLAALVGDTIYFFQDIVIGQRTDYTSGDKYDNAKPLPPSVVRYYDENGDIEAFVPLEGMDYYRTYDITEPRLFRVKTDGTGYEQLAGYKLSAPPETAQDNSQYYYLNMFKVIDANSAWVLEQGWFGYQDESGNWIDDVDIKLRKISLETGETLLEPDTTPITENNPYANLFNFGIDGSGNLICTGADDSGNHTIYAFATDGSLVFNHTISSDVGSITLLLTLPDGRAAISLYESKSGKDALKPLNIDTGEIGESIGSLPLVAWNIIGTAGNGKDLVAFSDNGLVQFTPGKPEKTEIVNWLDSDVDTNSLRVLGMTDSSVIAYITLNEDMARGTRGSTTSDTSKGESGASCQLIILKKTPASEVKQKEIVTLACNYTDYYLRAAILDFNRTDPNYRVKIIDYSSYNTQDDYTAGITKLNTEIISGNVPDLILVDELPFSIYASRGLLEDLYPYLEKDTELGGKDALTQAARNVMEDANGKLLQIAAGFTPVSVIGNNQVVNSQMGWTMDDFNAVLNANPGVRPFSFYMDRAQMLNLSLIWNVDEYIDFEAGEVYFDSPEFISFIEFIKTFPAEFDWDNYSEYKDDMTEIRNGNQLVYVTAVSNIDDYMTYDAQLGGNLVFKGFPCASANGHAVTLRTPLAMSVKCGNKDAAWSVMRMLISEDYQSGSEFNWYFPTNRNVFDKRVAEAMTEVTQNPNDAFATAVRPLSWSNGTAAVAVIDDSAPTPSQTAEVPDPEGTIVKEDGTKVYPKGWTYVNNEAIPYYAMTQAQYDKLLSFLNSITKIAQENKQLSEIINDELAPFFANQKSAEDTVKIIQNRTHMYVSEQR